MIKFSVGTYGHTSLRVYDMTLVDEVRDAGTYEETFNAKGLASGMYVYRLQAGEYTASKKLLLLR